jgi:hypothetical protein
MHGSLAVKCKTNVRHGGKMTNGINRQLVLLIAISILCIGVLPIVSAADASGDTLRISHASPDQVDLINKLWGSDITIGEYMETVHPEHLVDVPDEVKTQMFQRKMNWPDGKVENKITELSRLTSLTVTGYITKVSSSRIDFRGKSVLSSGTASYIYVEAFLKKGGSKVDSTAASAQGVGSVDTGYKMHFWPDDGTYRVDAWGYTITPGLEASDQTGTITIP